jgi:small subunit ribosomal protein S4
MARYTGPKAKLCRKFGENIFGTAKYDRIIGKRKYPSGQHGKNMRRKLSDYGVHLKEKQKLRSTYCLLEKQFRNYFFKAAKASGVTGDNLLQTLERRFDNVVYRMPVYKPWTLSDQRQEGGHSFSAFERRRYRRSETPKPWHQTLGGSHGQNRSQLALRLVEHR